MRAVYLKFRVEGPRPHERAAVHLGQPQRAAGQVDVRGEPVQRAAILAVPVRDTIKRVRAGTIVETPNRLECYAAQTPQVFRTELLREALEKALAEGFVGTDDAEIVERIGVPVTVVPAA